MMTIMKTMMMRMVLMATTIMMSIAMTRLMLPAQKAFFVEPQT